MIQRFVIREVNTGRFVGEGWRGFVADESLARIYKSKNGASNSRSRKRLNRADYEIVPVTFTFDKKDKWKVPNLNGVAALDFHTVVDYFRKMLTLDITGNESGHYQMSFNILEVFFDTNRFLRGMPNGSTFVISENTFAEQPAHIVMVGNEILRLFGFEEDSRRLAAFVVDWWDDDGGFVKGY